ncbi:MAG: hypothetical protein ACR2NB_12210 [Solirubrobacteraceae bacterium]
MRRPCDLAFTAYDRNREITQQPFRYRRCDACGAYSLVDVPVDLESFYPSEYYDQWDVEALEGLRWVEEHKVAAVRAHVAAGPIVEIGHGPGVFAHAAKREGYDGRCARAPPATAPATTSASTRRSPVACRAAR